MTSAIHDMYKKLEDCVESLESDVRRSLEDATGENFDQTVVALETSKDYHYKEILNQLTQIKDHIKIIAEHNKSLHLLQNKINGTKIDRNYIKKQVETFQKMGVVNRRERKPVRPRETSSMKLLECWEKVMEEQQTKESSGKVFSVPKRTTHVRKNKRIVSSTVDTLLESTRMKSLSLDLLTEESTNGEDLPAITKCISSDCLVMQNSKYVEAINEILVEDDEETSCGNIAGSENVAGITKESSSTKENSLEKRITKPRIVEVIYKKKTNGDILTH